MKDLWLSLVLMIALWAESSAAGLWASRFPDRNRAVTLHVVVAAGKLRGDVIFFVNRSGEIVGPGERSLIHLNTKMLRFEMTLVNEDEGDCSPISIGCNLK